MSLALSEAIWGKGTSQPGERGFSFRTIENPSYLIPPGTYTLGLHRWSKSGRLVPILQNVPASPEYPAYAGDTKGFRTGILIHNGTREEHSHGCLLAPQSVIDSLVTLIQSTHEKVTITIK